LDKELKYTIRQRSTGRNSGSSFSIVDRAGPVFRGAWGLTFFFDFFCFFFDFLCFILMPGTKLDYVYRIKIQPVFLAGIKMMVKL